jgi:acetolactate synthase-1/2/3 large subunit
MLGMVAQWQRMFYKSRYSATRLGRIPDFVKLATAYGAHGERVESLDQLSSILRRAISSDVTTVIDVPIDPEANVLPMVPPGKSIDEMIVM